ncbi:MULTISPECIES: hypothetical protein [Tsukamurella]|uniref:Uncharacterized protein n=1 Tax=Tsukamurella asaccharolytica TaxID=2592067 RepID=A0A5C5R509_9ACTN|nr:MULTISPECIES: hypothetical protein [Tsukamurella]TWS17756.1 hypothetical protein FK529_18860 [Tsukamurella asaccharolytica]
MSKTGRINQRRGERGIPKTRQPRHITVRSVRREPPDLRKLARAIIAQALAEANADADAASDRVPPAAVHEGREEVRHD